MNSRAFTLIEMLVATVLSAVLIGALLLIASRLANDRAHLAKQTIVDHSGIQAFLEWDFQNAEHGESITADRIDLIGHNAIDPATLQPNFRAAAVTYELQPMTHELIRRQRLMDDASTSISWQSVIARHVKQMTLSEPDGSSSKLQLELDDGVIEVAWQR